MTTSVDEELAPPPLHGLRVIECSDTVSGAWSGRLLVDLGADVVHVEDLAGDPLRRRGPFPQSAVAHPELSASHAYFHCGKRSLAVGLASEEGRRRVLDLARHADVLIVSSRRSEPWLSEGELTAAEQDNPGLIVAEPSTFGSSGPYRSRPGGDLIALAAGGLLSLNAVDRTDPESMPVRPFGEASSFHTGAALAVAILGAIHARDATGRGQRVDVSAQEVVAGSLVVAIPLYSYLGVVPVHYGSRSICPWSVYQCADGWVLMHCTEEVHWKRLVDVLGSPEWATTELFATGAGRAATAEAVESLVAAELAQWTVDAFLRETRQRGVPAARINTARDLLAWDHLRERSYFQPVNISDGASSFTVSVPGAPFRLHGTRPVACTDPPRLGEHSDVAFNSQIDEAARPTTAASPSDGAGPLRGVRVVDLSRVWAGPLAAMVLAHLGAEVIKIESSDRLDLTRRLGPFADGVPGPNRSGFFNQYNQGKRSVCLDLQDETGRQALDLLLASADVVIDNWSAGALAAAGYSYERMRQLNRAIVAVSITGFGETGPERDRLVYGAGIDALSGHASLTGLPGGPPADSALNLPDPNAGMHAAVATLAALYRARRTGRGERVEISLLEAAVATLPWHVLEHSCTGREPGRLGNRDPEMSPHGVFRCRGTGEWVAIAVRDDVDFTALCGAMGRPELASDDAFAHLEQRKANEAALEELVSVWCADHDAAELAESLADVGVPAHRVDDIGDVMQSPHLAERAYFAALPHAECGVRRLAGVPWRASSSPMRAGRAAPLLGQDTEAVLCELRGDEENSANITRPSDGAGTT